MLSKDAATKRQLYLYIIGAKDIFFVVEHRAIYNSIQKEKKLGWHGPADCEQDRICEHMDVTMKRKNKAGYTANTSRGRVGRGGNARFHTFKLDHHGPTNQPTDQPTDGRTKLLIESLVRD